MTFFTGFIQFGKAGTKTKQMPQIKERSFHSSFSVMEKEENPLFRILKCWSVQNRLGAEEGDALCSCSQHELPLLTSSFLSLIRFSTSVIALLS